MRSLTCTRRSSVVTCCGSSTLVSETKRSFAKSGDGWLDSRRQQILASIARVIHGGVQRLHLQLAAHRVVLYMLIWGSGQPHLPECLCLLLYCASNALVVEHPVTSQETGSLPTTYSPGQIARLPIDIASALSRPMFLEALVEPMYRFLAQEISDRHQEDVSKRVMYDDVNEFFWNPSKIHASALD